MKRVRTGSVRGKVLDELVEVGEPFTIVKHGYDVVLCLLVFNEVGQLDVGKLKKLGFSYESIGELSKSWSRGVAGWKEGEDDEVERAD